MTSTINASSTGSGGIVQTADASGVLALQANGTTAFTVNSDATTTFASAANLPNTFGFKNRIINGGMAIDQRNAGAVTTPTNGVYTLDRYFVYQSTAGKFSVQQTPSATETGYATRVAAGFTNYLAAVSLSAYTVSATDSYAIVQRIEAFNFSDMAWGTANAKTITLSFLVYSSLTGTFGGALINSAGNRTYPFSYTVSSANTWTSISLTIAGDTSGTWLGATNGVGVEVRFGLGSGTNNLGTAGAWATGNYVQPTGTVSVVGTNGATFYITGVQLEKGSTATSFDFRPYTTELALCQRYFCKNSSPTVVATNGAALGTAGMYSSGAVSAFATNAGYVQWISFPVSMRTEPATITIINTGLPTSPTSGQWSIYYTSATAWVNGAVGVQSYTTNGMGLVVNGAWNAAATMFYGAWTASAEL